MEIDDDVAQHIEDPPIWMGMGIERREDGYTASKPPTGTITWNSKRQYGKSMKEKQQKIAPVESCLFGWFFLQARSPNKGGGICQIQ